MKLLPFILSEKYIYSLALEMASHGNQHCVNVTRDLGSMHVYITPEYEFSSVQFT